MSSPSDAERKLREVHDALGDLAEAMGEKIVSNAYDPDEPPDPKYKVLTPTDIEKLREIFDMFDVDGNVLSAMKLFTEPAELVQVTADIDHNNSGTVEFHEYLEWVDVKATKDPAFYAAYRVDLHNTKLGFDGTRWRSSGNILWIISGGIMIMTGLLLLTAVIYFRFILVPLVMAYFLTFILAPLQDVLIQRPLICGSVVYCDKPCVRPGKENDTHFCGKKLSWYGEAVSPSGSKVPLYQTQAERWAEEAHDGVRLEDGQWDAAADVMRWEADESICCYAVPPKQFSSVKSAGGHPIKNCCWQLFALAKIPDVLSVLMTFVVAAAILVSTITVVATEMIEVIEDHAFQQRFNSAVEDVNNYLRDEWDMSVAELQNLQNRTDKTTEVTTDDLSTVFTPYLLALNDIVFTLLLCMYMLATRRPESEEEAFKNLETMSMIEKITAKIKHYVVLKTALSFLTGVLTGLFLWITGVRLFFLFALLTFILNFIPNVGSLMAMLLPIPIILLDEVPDDRFPGPDILRQMLAFLLPAMVQMYVGNVLEPAVFGESLNVTAISVLVALVLWGSIWGIQGAILSVPLLAAFKIGLEEADYPLAKLVLRMIRETSSVDDMVSMNHTRAERRAHREKLDQSMKSNRTKLKADVSKINNPMISSPSAREVPG